MVNENLVEIVGIIDRSGSMSTIRDDAEKGFNSFIKEQKKNIIGKDVKVTIAQFDNEYEIVCNGLDIKKFKKYTLVPRGSTALYDAIGRTVDVVGQRLSSVSEEERPCRIIVVVMSKSMQKIILKMDSFLFLAATFNTLFFRAIQGNTFSYQNFQFEIS